MNRFLTILILTGMVFFTLPFTTGSAFPSTDAAYDIEQNFAPGSIIQFEHLTIEDRLSQNAGLAIFQDSRGFLWVGSQDGFNRYDGYTFKIFKHDPDDPNSISSNSILAIAEDKEGTLWIGPGAAD